MLFVEHRYYGESIPRAASEPTWAWTPEGSYGLTVENTLRDFEAVVDSFKDGTNGNYGGPVIAFGGSYGGMLSAWMRMKYPSKVYGALAASAPVRWFVGVIDPTDYNTKSTEVISNQINGEACMATITQGFVDLRNLQMDSSYYSSISEKFFVCPGNLTTPELYASLLDMVSDTIESSP